MLAFDGCWYFIKPSSKRSVSSLLALCFTCERCSKAILELPIIAYGIPKRLRYTLFSEDIRDMGYQRCNNRNLIKRMKIINSKIVTYILFIHSLLRSFADIIYLVFLKTIKSSRLNKLFQGYKTCQNKSVCEDLVRSYQKKNHQKSDIRPFCVNPFK